MAQFLYFTGPMDSGKSTLALQFDYTYATSGRLGRLFTSRDRAGESTISSRIGLVRPAIEVDPEFSFWHYVVDQLTGGERIDYLVCDESQFYHPDQVDELARIVDELQIDVFAVGILTDFRTRLFPGSQRLVELCDRMETLQVHALCWCGERATHNARTMDGEMVVEGDQVVVGDTLVAELGAEPVVAYEVLCRRHHRRHVTRAVARATLSDPLPVRRRARPRPGRRAGVTGPLLQPAELAGLLAAPADLVVADVRWTLNGPPGRPEFEAGHVPGAQWLDLEAELSAPPGAGGRHPLPDPEVVQAALRRIGVHATTLVVACDGAAALAAARLWWLLSDAALAVRVLDGGFAGWRAAGFEVETGPAPPVAPGSVTLRPGRRPRVDAEQLRAALAGGRPVVDVRAADRYAGRNETVDPVAGHIPGAVNRPSTGNADDAGRFRPAAEIAARFAGLDDPVLYCGSGITAAQTLLALESAGRTGVIYPGSWSDWITDPSRPVAVGSDPGVVTGAA